MTSVGGMTSVHYAGPEATEEEWHDSLVTHDFIETEEEENAIVRSGCPGSARAERRPGEQGDKMDLVGPWSSHMVLAHNRLVALR